MPASDDVFDAVLTQPLAQVGMGEATGTPVFAAERPSPSFGPMLREQFALRRGISPSGLPSSDYRRTFSHA